MTIDEFQAASRVADKKLTLAIVAIVIPWLVIFMIIVVSYESATASALSFLLGVVVASALLVPIWFVSRALARKHGLTCPHCSYWFIGSYAAEVLRTRQCPKCKQEVFDTRSAPVFP